MIFFFGYAFWLRSNALRNDRDRGSFCIGFSYVGFRNAASNLFEQVPPTELIQILVFKVEVAKETRVV